MEDLRHDERLEASVIEDCVEVGRMGGYMGSMDMK